MAEEPSKPAGLDEDTILHQQYLRALSSFEGIILSQIDLKNKLGDRLNYSIQAGILILGAIAVSISVLLFTLTSQITRISGTVDEMNSRFLSVSNQMNQIKHYMSKMEIRVRLLESIRSRTALMDQEMTTIRNDMVRMHAYMGGIDDSVAAVRDHVSKISVNIDLMNREVQTMSAEMQHMSRPARAINRMMPFP